MSKKIRFGVIGTNIITEKFIEAAKKCEHFELNAIYSRTSERAQLFASKYNVKHIFTDLEELLTSDVVDAMYIASPNAMHAQQAILC
ncbi:MAG: Gfo/Idh/MocA family oxidoreductase, partial [bacterium]|nr:Gfo/Idh/MocA family oxidoreductase [bacterium]